MANKQIIFELKVLGTDTQIKSQNELAAAIKQVNTQLKAAELGSDAYRALEAELGNLKNAQKDVADSAKTMQRELQAQGDTYRALNAELVNARALYKELTKAEREGAVGDQLRARIKALDTELKALDAEIGQFQRNVGNYEGAITTAFAPIKDMLSTSVPGFQQLDAARAVFQDGIGQLGQAATATGKILTGAFIGFQVIGLILDGVQAIRDFSAEINQLRGEIDRLSNDTPAAVDRAVGNIQAISATFKAENEEIMQAANALVQNYGVTFEEATQRIEQGFLAGSNASGKYLDVLIEMAPKAKGAGASLDQFSVALAESGRAGLQEEEAIEKVIQKSAEFTGTVDTLIDKTNTLTARQIEQLAAEKELSAAKAELSARTNLITQETENLTTKMQTYGLRALSYLIDLSRKAAGASIGLQEVVAEVWQRLVNTWQSGVLGVQIAYNQIQNLLTGAEGAEIAALQAERAKYETTGRSYAEAFMQGYNSVVNAQAAPEQQGGPNEPNRAARIAQGLTAQQLAEAAKKAAEERKKLHDAAMEAEARYGEQRYALLNELTARIIDAGVQNIQDQTERELAEERRAFEVLQAERTRQAQEQEQQFQEARQKIVEAYGARSAQVAAFDRQALADTQARQELAARLEQEQLMAHLRRMEEIRADSFRRENQQALERIRARLDATRQGYQIEANAAAIGLERAINDVLRGGGTQEEKDAIVLRLRLRADQANIQQQILLIDEQAQAAQARLDAIANGDGSATASIEEYNFLNEQLDAYALKRAQLERQYTETVIQEAQKRASAKDAEVQKTLGAASQALELMDRFAEASFQREMSRIQEKETANQSAIESLEQKLQTATGAEKVQLEKRLENEKKVAEQLAKQREALEKEERQRAKAFAVIQSIINTALSVSRALATPPAPNVFAASLAGALGAAQTTIIAAQPAAEGALIGSNVPHQGSGLVVMAQNIPTMRNGDNVLATVKRGEVVLNRAQQQALGGAPVFRALRVPGFADGGATGAILSAPDLSGISGAERMKQLEANQQLLIEYIAATNGRVDRMRAFVVSSDVQADLVEGEKLRVAATLG